MIERLSDEGLTELARGIVTNQVFVAWDSEAMHYAFGLMLSAVAAEKPDWLDDAGLPYEYMSQASERGVNGYPMFFSIKFIHKLDVEPLMLELHRMCEALGQMPPGLAEAVLAIREREAQGAGG